MTTTEDEPASSKDLRPEWVSMLRLAAGGMTKLEIAKHMSIPPTTIHSRFARIRYISGSRTMAQIISWAYNEGLLILAKEVKPVKELQASLSGQRSKNRELTQELRRAENRIGELEAELRAAHAQIGSVPWLTTHQGRL